MPRLMTGDEIGYIRCVILVRSHYAILFHAMVQTFYITRFMLVVNHKVNQT